MSLHNIALFLHVVGALAFGAGAFLSLSTFWALRRAQRVEQVRSILGLFSFAGPILGIGMLLNFVTGLYMTADTWGWQTPWIIVAIVTLFLYIGAGAVMGTRRAAIAKSIGELPDGALPETVVQRVYDPLFGTSVNMMLALLLGIVYLMTAKPTLNDSIIAIVVASILGLVASLPLWSAKPAGTAIETRQQREG
jgi:MFS family permease